MSGQDYSIVIEFELDPDLTMLLSQNVYVECSP